MRLSDLSRSLFLQCYDSGSVFHQPLDFHHAPPQFIPHSAASAVVLQFRCFSQKKPRFLNMMCPCGTVSSALYPPLAASAPSQLFHRRFLWSPGLWTRCRRCPVWSALFSSFGWLECCLLWKAFSAFPLLDESPSCSGSRKTFSIFYSIISHSVILASLFACRPK